MRRAVWFAHMATAQTSDGIAINYDTVGAGRDLVLVHGLTDASGTWGPITGALAETHRVTTLDLRGMGASEDADDYSSIGMVRDIEAVVGAAGITDPLVIGHSLGGVVVTVYAATAQVRGVINVDQPLQLSGFQEGLRQVEALLRDPQSFPAVIEAVFAGMNGELMNAELQADIASHVRRRQEVVLGVWDEVLSTPVAELDDLIAQMTAGIAAPYLSLHFGHGAPDYTEWLHALIPHAIVEQWSPALGHYGHRIEAQRFVARVREFDSY